MKNGSIACVVVVWFCLANPACAQDRDGKDDVVGTIWRYTITNGNKKDNGQFRVYKKDIFKGSKKVGEVHPKDEDETTLVFTNYEEFKGKAVLRKTKTSPPTWNGTLHRQNGTHWKMEVVVKDK